MEEEISKIPKIAHLTPSNEESKSTGCLLDQSKNISIENDEDNLERDNFSPSKYFGKRPSFEFKNLKNIEKTTHRAHSAIHEGKSNSSISNLGKVEDSEEESNEEMGGSKVHFSIKNM
jgi:hypothetical protein